MQFALLYQLWWKKLVFGQFSIVGVLWFSPVILSSHKAITDITLPTC